MASMCASQSGSTIAIGGSDSARATSVIDRSSQFRRRSKASGSPGEKAWIQARSTPSACSVGAKASLRTRLAGQRKGGALEDAGGPDRNLAPLVTGQVGELGQRLHRGHPRHGFRS